MWDYDEAHTHILIDGMTASPQADYAFRSQRVPHTFERSNGRDTGQALRREHQLDGWY
jgi:hypothetical protein